MLRKLVLIITLGIFSLGISGCICKTDKNILKGMTSLEIAVQKMSVQNAMLWQKEIDRVATLRDAATTLEEKEKYSEALKNAEAMLRANIRLPEVIKELRLALEGKGLNE